MPSNDSFKTRQDLSVGRKKYAYYSLPAAEEAAISTQLPIINANMDVLVESLIRLLLLNRIRIIVLKQQQNHPCLF